MPRILYCEPTSPSCRAVLLAIRYLNITDIEFRLCNAMSTGNLDPDLIELAEKNPQDTLPFLDDNGFHLPESRAIIYYLVASRDPNSSLLGTNIKEKTLIQHRMQYELHTWSPLTPQVLGPIMQGEVAKVTDENVKIMQDAFATIDGFLSETRYIASNNVTIADFSYVAWMSTFIHIGFPILERFQNIARWYDKCSDLPGFDDNDQQANAVGSYVKDRISEPIIFFD